MSTYVKRLVIAHETNEAWGLRVLRSGESMEIMHRTTGGEAELVTVQVQVPALTSPPHEKVMKANSYSRRRTYTYFYT